VHLAYTFGFNGFRLPKDQPWRSNLIDQARILADAADARARGAEFVMVSLHWGIEGRSRPTTAQRQARSGNADPSRLRRCRERLGPCFSFANSRLDAIGSRGRGAQRVAAASLYGAVRSGAKARERIVLAE